jgi:uncharacterized RDD family membrane protein YckC
VRSTLNPLAALAAALLVAAALCAAFLALLAASAALRLPAAMSMPMTPDGATWMISFAPSAALLGVVGAGALAGALFRSERRVGPALRVTTRVRQHAARARD